MKKYYATFTVNYGQTYTPTHLEYSNKAKAIRNVREIAEGQVNGTQNCNWYVFDNSGKTVASGGRCDGIRFRSL